MLLLTIWIFVVTRPLLLKPTRVHAAFRATIAVIVIVDGKFTVSAAVDADAKGYLTHAVAFCC
jgi:hypothetical protein